MPSSNDNFANADVITGQSGATGAVYDTAGATTESGEPASNGRTLWFKWTCPAGKSDRYIFNTVDSLIPTRLDVFTGSAVNALTAVPGAHCYSGFNLQCKVIFLATEGVDYYVRIDGRNGAEGPVALSWGVYHAGRRLGDCAQCCSTHNKREHCAGTVEFSNASLGTRMDVSSRNLSFGTKPEGPYILRTCYGAWRFAPQRPPPNAPGYDETWVVSRCPTGFPTGSGGAQYGPGGWFIFCIHSGTAKAFPGEPVPTSTALGTATAFESQAIAEEKTRCAETSFYHTGGDISMQFYDDLYIDNVHGAGGKGPKYGLFFCDPAFEISSICTARLGSNSFRITFNVQNTMRAPFPNVEWTLDLSGGIASATQPGGGAMPRVVSFDPLQNKPVSFDYTCSTPGETFLTVTLKGVLADGTVLPNMVQSIRPILVTTVPGAATTTSCGSFTRTNATVRVTNNGSAATDALVATFTPLTNWSRWLNGCVPLAGTTRAFNLFNVNGCGVATNPVIQFERATGGASTFQVDFADTAGRTHPPAVISV